MRSRFSAYCKRDVAYIVRTTHKDNSQLKAGGSRSADGRLLSTFAEDVQATTAKLRFSDLRVAKEEDGPAGKLNIKLVSFEYKVAIVGQRGFGARVSAAEQVQETSVFVFVKEDGEWLFLDSKDVIKNALPV